MLVFFSVFLFIALNTFIQVNCNENLFRNSSHRFTLDNFQQDNIYSTLYIAADKFQSIGFWEDVFTEESIPHVSKGCNDALYTFTSQTNDPYNSLIYLVDSFAKPPKGVLEGNFKWLGDWNECKELNNTRYVRIVIPVVPLLGYVVSFVGLSLAPDIGICLPAACSNKNDTLNIIDHVLSLIQPYVPIILPDIFNTSTFEVIFEQTDSLDGVSYLAITVIALIIMLVIVGSIVHLITGFLGKFNSWRDTLNILPTVHIKPSQYPDFHYLSNSEFDLQGGRNEEGYPIEYSIRNKSLISKIKVRLVNSFRCFSLFSNIKLLLNSHSHSSHSINCLSGLRSLSMLWILMCHSYFWLLLTGAIADVENMLYYDLPLFTFTISWNGFASLDTLFAISGCLAIYNSFKQLENHTNYLIFVLRYYLYHILRIVPTYYALVLIMWGLTPYIGTGPMWSSAVRKIVGNCEDYWWTNALFINTFYPTNLLDSCLSWSWYIVLEMQFILLSPLFIIPAHYFRVCFSLILPISVFIISTAAMLLVLFINDINSYIYYLVNNYLGLFNLKDLLDNAQVMTEAMVNQYYTKFYLRIPPYLAGMVAGYFLYKIPNWRKFCKNVKIFDRVLAVICMIISPISVILLIVLMFTPNWLFHGMPIVPGLVYTLLSVVKNLWGIGIAALIFTLTLGFGGPLGKILTWKVWAPLSRLTLMAYLIHPIVMTVFYLTLRRTISYDSLPFSFIIAGLMVATYAVASVFTILIYLPIKNLLKEFQ